MQELSGPTFSDLPEKPRFNKSHPSAPTTNGNGHGMRDPSPPPKLERVTQGSIPISLIAERVVRRSYGEFLNLAETYYRS
jgi:hypothetical protein